MKEKTSDLGEVRRGFCVRVRFVSGLLAAVAVAAGCSPSVKFMRTECLYLPERAGPGSVAFVSTFEARNLTNEQLVYHVSLERSGDRPVRAPGTQYRDKDGRVAATRSVICLSSPQTFENTRVAIPVGQLGVTPEDSLVTAVFAVNRADGSALATDRLPLPLARVHRALGSSSAPPPSNRGNRPARQRRPAKSSKEQAPRRPARSRREATSQANDERRGERPLPADSRETEKSSPAALESARQDQRPDERATSAEKTSPKPAGAPGESIEHVEKPSQLRYVVRHGDTLSDIAKQTLGQASSWPAILEANRDQISAPEDLREGMELIIPEGP